MMKDLSLLKYFLGIKVACMKNDIFLLQRKYSLNFLHETGVSTCQPIDMLLEEDLKLWYDPYQLPCDKKRYKRSVGRLKHMARAPYATSVVSQFMHDLRGNIWMHWCKFYDMKCQFQVKGCCSKRMFIWRLKHI